MLPLLPHDKANHAVYGAAIFAAGHLAAGPVAGAALCVLLAVGKELRDRLSRRGTPDALDALATVAGGALAAVPLIPPLI